MKNPGMLHEIFIRKVTTKTKQKSNQSTKNSNPAFLNRLSADEEEGEPIYATKGHRLVSFVILKTIVLIISAQCIKSKFQQI
jgi:hypothetical protein